jgi:hypothetical protein
VQTVVLIPYIENSEEICSGVEEALETVGIEPGASANASWLDLSIMDIGRALAVRRLGGVVPCRSLWDVSGRRLAVVLVFDTITTG